MILSYDNAKRSLFNMAVYLICTSLIIKGFGYLVEFNVVQTFQALASGSDFSIALPEFNMDSLSFDMVSNAIKEQVEEILTVLLPSALGFANLHYLNTVTANQVLLSTTKFALKV